MYKKLFSINRNEASTAEEIYNELKTQSFYIETGELTVDDIEEEVETGFITLTDEEIIVGWEDMSC